MDTDTSLICSLRIGKITIHLKCPSDEYARDVREYFNAGAEGKADSEIDLEITAGDRNIRIPDSLFTTKSVRNNHFTIEDDCAKGFFDTKTGKGKIQVHYLLTSSLRTRLFEQLLYQAFYSAAKRAGYHALLMHSCGVIKEHCGYLFVGKAESGKTTVAELSREYSVLNDEIMMIDLGGDTPVIYSTPFNGYFKDKVEGTATLGSLFLLQQSGVNRITEIKKSLAVKTLFHEIVPVIGLEETITPETHEAMLDYAAEIAQKTPVYNLEFRKDSGFWAEIEKVIV
jgi:hypothetical protein